MREFQKLFRHLVVIVIITIFYFTESYIPYFDETHKLKHKYTVKMQQYEID